MNILRGINIEYKVKGNRAMVSYLLHIENETDQTIEFSNHYAKEIKMLEI